MSTRCSYEGNIGDMWIGAFWLVAMMAAPVGSPRRDASSRAADIRWLNRVTWGVDSSSLSRLETVGRRRFLEEQLSPTHRDSAEDAARGLGSPKLEPLADLLTYSAEEQKRIKGLTDPDEVQTAREALNQKAQAFIYEQAKRQLFRALFSRAQLREQMIWFWTNHFNVFAQKGDVKWALADFEEQAIRPNALGSFRRLLLATMTSPAMLLYLDNAQSAVGKINENYARELLELHTLGVSGGPSGSKYTQQDIQELARVLTGLTVSTRPSPKLAASQQKFYVRNGAFELNPLLHDFGEKQVLGQRIRGDGMAEVEQVATLLVRQPATARYICTKMALYFVGSAAPPALVQAMIQTFIKTEGDIAAVLQTLFLYPGLDAALKAGEPSLKDPIHFVVSAVRLAYEGKSLKNAKPLTKWLNLLGQPLFNRVTPDGYSLTEDAWASTGQWAQRFEIARAIGSGYGPLFETEDGKPTEDVGFPMLTTRFYYDALEPMLSPSTVAALGKAKSQMEWNTFLLSSPELMFR